MADFYNCRGGHETDFLATLLKPGIHNLKRVGYLKVIMKKGMVPKIL